METGKDELADRLDEAKPRRAEFDTVIDKFEGRWATGFVRRASGSLAAADGLVARSGRLRILPGWLDDDTEWLEAMYADWLRDLTDRVLTGPALIVFRGRILDPLCGKPQRSFQGLAAEIGSNTARVYKLLELSIRKLKVAAMNKEHLHPKPDPKPRRALRPSRRVEIAIPPEVDVGDRWNLPEYLANMHNPDVSLRFKFYSGGKKYFC